MNRSSGKQLTRFLTAIAFLVICLVALAPAPAEATWLYAAQSIFQAEGKEENHPDSLTQVLLMPHDAVRPMVCVAYTNSLGKGKQGRVQTLITVTRPPTVDIFGLEVEAKEQQLSISGGVDKNSFLECKVGPDMTAGDLVTFEHQLRGMRRVPGGEGDFAEVAGVVSDAGEPELWTAPTGIRLAEGNSPNGLVPNAGSGWFHAVNSIFQAEKGTRKHPKKLNQSLAVPEDAGGASVCASYSNRARNGDRGKVTAQVSIAHADGATESVKLSGSVRDNSWVGCKKVGALSVGDVLDFRFSFARMPKLSKGEPEIDFADVSAIVSTTGEPSYRDQPAPDPDPPFENVPAPSSEPPSSEPASPGDGADPSPPPPSGGGAISAADAQAAYKLLVANSSTQLWRPKNNNPSLWIAVGPRTRAISGNTLDLNTAGVGNSIASAVANYESKMGSLGGATGTVSAADQSALAWYAGMNPSGPTSIRRSPTGYFGEFYRQGLGAQHNGPLESIAAAVSWLRSKGL